MFEGLIEDVVDYHGDVVRNIKGIRQSQSLFDDLSADPGDQAVAIAAENQARIASPAPLITRPFDYGAVITYPFVPHNWHATRFSDGSAYGVWYGSLAMDATVYETVYHWHRFVTDSFAAEDREIVGERRILNVGCGAILLDLRGKQRREPRLVDRRDYAFTHQLGRYLREQSQNGLLVRSARCKGTNAAILRSEVLSNVRDLCFLTYRLNPLHDRVGVERSPGTLWLEIRPSALG